MLQRCGELDLAPEALDVTPAASLRRQHLHDDAAAERGLPGEEDVRHSAAAELALDAVGVTRGRPAAARRVRTLRINVGFGAAHARTKAAVDGRPSLCRPADRLSLLLLQKSLTTAVPNISLWRPRIGDVVCSRGCSGPGAPAPLEPRRPSWRHLCRTLCLSETRWTMARTVRLGPRSGVKILSMDRLDAVHGISRVMPFVPVVVVLSVSGE